MNSVDETLYWSSISYQGEDFRLLAAEHGLLYIAWPREPEDALSRYRDLRAPGASLVYDRQRLSAAARQLEEYWAGERRTFTLDMDLRGTPFQVGVWRCLQQIPYGQVVSYSELARRSGRPEAVRAVGTAVGRNPLPIIIPCHRVMGKNGNLTGFQGGLSWKARMLRLEGYQDFIEKGHARFVF